MSLPYSKIIRPLQRKLKGHIYAASVIRNVKAHFTYTSTNTMICVRKALASCKAGLEDEK